MVLYKEFRVGDLFRLKSIRQIPRGFVPELKEDGDYPYLTQKTGGSYGVNGYMDETDEIELIEEPMIITGVDNVANGVMYWWDKPFYANKMLGLINENLNRERAQYIITVLLKMYMGFDYNNKINMKIVRETDIQLPVKTLEDTEPDWEYMEEYIKQKELAYIGKLNKEFEQKKEQLIELIGEESEYINIEELPTAKFKVGDLFNIYTGKDLILGKLEKGNIPVISHSADNNGISHRSGKIETRPLYDKDRVISLADRGTFKAYVQQEDFYVGTRVKALEVKDDFQVSKEVLQYLATTINKLSELFDYSMNATGKIPELEIVLPNNPEVSEIVPDWETMEKYIARIELQLLNRVINTLNT